ncbi:MAG TPA: 5-dehydro-4-deoxy-D-glucuronate isomerase [Verrucomicrobiae bacterium]|nr:5-dehydro-4-deoxy-D-glucuronate isomerase [Verrucomicrobiae bacterium]
MEPKSCPDIYRYVRLTTDELRAGYLVENLFQPGAARLIYTDVDRAVLGGVVPTSQKLSLETSKELAAQFFAERREIGVINIGGKGMISVDAKEFTLAKRDCLYIGRGSQRVEFASSDPKGPAWFYLVSYPAHAVHPTRLATPADAEPVDIGSQRDANQRTIYKYIHLNGIKSCQLVMGFTELKEGSVWNTMPPHTHTRRSEIYLYFDVAPEAAVFHFMGSAQETRHLVVRNGEAVLSPPWSMHCGSGTRNYSFTWAMGGENQEFSDMDQIAVKDLK